jgi:WD40 repeat protein
MLYVQVVLYQALTGRLCWVLGSHAGMVHSISWAKDDSAVITASADFTVKIWHLPELPGPPYGSPQSSLMRHYSGMQFDQSTIPPLSGTADMSASSAAAAAAAAAGTPAGTSAMCAMSANTTYVTAHSIGSPNTWQHGRGFSQSLGYTGAATAAAAGAAEGPAAAAGGGVSVNVLQHTCFVYAAELHPTLQPMPTVVTAGFDGVLRLWNLQGVLLYSLLVRLVACNAAVPVQPSLLWHVLESIQ